LLRGFAVYRQKTGGGDKNRVWKMGVGVVNGKKVLKYLPPGRLTRGFSRLSE